jgi:hypothetical protein
MTFDKIDQVIFDKVTKYYTEHEDHFKTLVDIINQRHKISISLIESFILIYAKNKSTMYIRSNGDFFLAYAKYKDFLKGYGKKCVDPFKRKRSENEDDYYITLHDIKLQTRLSQLHFFIWAFKMEIIDYISDNLEDIESYMSTYKKNKTKTKTKIQPIVTIRSLVNKS